ncbi:RNA-directed DNA polymerase, eukaryota [Tanacetum coccineum]
MTMGANEGWQEVNYKKNRSRINRSELPSIQEVPKTRNYRSKEDDVAKISVSVFITNFPDSCSAKDLFNSCKQYGHVVDSYIPNKRSITGKRFGFVRFINVFNKVGLVENLSTVWIGQQKLQVNLPRFDRSSNRGTKTMVNEEGERKAPINTFAQARVLRNRNHSTEGVEKVMSLVMVLDEECLTKTDISKSLFYRVKVFASLANLKPAIGEEGFEEIKISYMGESWVKLDFVSLESMKIFKENGSIGSWFSCIKQADKDFVIEGRVAWVEIEGIPLNFGQRIHSGKLLIGGETVGWVPDFADDVDEEDQEENVSKEGGFDDDGVSINDVESEVNEVPETINEGEVRKSSSKKNGDKDDQEDDSLEFPPGYTPKEDYIPTPLKNDGNQNKGEANEVHSSNNHSVDPFGIYEILNNKKADGHKLNEDGFSKFDEPVKVSVQKVEMGEEECVNRKGQNRKNTSSDTQDSCCSGHFKKSSGPRSGGSIIQGLEDLVNVGQVMGYDIEAVGQSGGILCVWDDSMFQKYNHTVSDFFVMVRGMWIPSGKNLLVISVYAPQDLKEKRLLWNYLCCQINSWEGDVITMGDFNEVRSNSERYGSVFNKIGAKHFNEFIANAGLVEIPLGGCSYTWCHKSAKKMSKLDRFLISDSLLNSCPGMSSVSLDRYLSDHRPILMRESYHDYGPIPFKFYHYWFEYRGFDKFVADSWKGLSISDTNDYVLFMKKLRIMKEKIKVWIRSYQENSNGQLKRLKADLNNIDFVLDKGSGETNDVQCRNDVVCQIQELEKIANMEMAQKAKIRWAVEGDENSKYYHGVINKKRNNLSIRGVMVEGTWIESPALVKKAFFDHFKSQFEHPSPSNIVLERDFSNKVSLDQVEDLERTVSKDEIKRAVWDCGVDKSPGPDGFTFGFYRRFWTTIEDDVCKAVVWFFQNNFIPNGGNSSFVTLIPKIPNANKVKDYRPISLIGSVYKIIAKILANRLVMVLGDIVSDSQSAFVKDRQILDDFEKAYDSVRWDYIEIILKKFGFGDKWCKWIDGCLRTSRGSVLVNGSPTTEFQFGKGLKQGDPLSPFLFILVMESLHVSFQRVVDAGLFSGIKLDNSTSITHLFYADDAIFMGHWNCYNIELLTRVLEIFHKASGMRINMTKSKLLGISVTHDIAEQAASKIGCSVLKMPFTYLGSKVGSLMTRSMSWNEVVERMVTRLSRWKLKTLSIGGRLTLLKSVLGSIPLYHMAMYKVPKKVLHVMERIRARFFIGAESTVKKHSWVSWKKTMASKDYGGLGVASLFALNRALIFKWIWRFISQKNSLWARVIKAIHGDDGKIGNTVKAGYPSIWLSIIQEMGVIRDMGIDILNYIKPNCGDGSCILFWEDNWRNDAAFKDLYPRLYMLENVKDSSVADKLAHEDLERSFRRKPRGGRELQQLESIKQQISGCILSNSKDRWTWSLEGLGEFTVSSLREAIDSIFLPNDGSKTRWIKEVPIKVNIIAWKISHD